MKIRGAVPLWTLLAVSSFVSQVLSAEWVTSEKLQHDMEEGELMKNLDHLDRIARENGGNRAFGLPGFDASREYVLERTRRFSQTVDTWVQDFPALFNKIESISFKVDGREIDVFGLTFSPSTTHQGITKQLILGPEGAAGCSVQGYRGLDVRDKIVLIDRFSCPEGGTLAGRARPAKEAGVSAVIIYNNVPTLITGGTLSEPDPETFVSSGFIDQVEGLSLRKRLLSGEKIMAFFQQTQITQTKITQNVFAETKDGDSQNVIMLGAHLDSVQSSPGINDAGSGVSIVLELLTALQRYKVRNKIRFAFWGAEENGLFGSRFYTSTLNTTSVNSLLCYLNFDMVSRGYFGVFDGDGSAHGLAGPPGSDVIEKLFVDHFTKRKIAVTPAAFSGGSDYAAFMDNLRKPVGGLHTGTGLSEDPCYHQKCDTYDNANSTTLTENAKAAAHVLATLAMQGEKLIPKNITLIQEAQGGNNFGAMRWKQGGNVAWTVLEGERHLEGTCGHDV